MPDPLVFCGGGAGPPAAHYGGTGSGGGGLRLPGTESGPGPGTALAYSPVNRYILLYAAVYLAATATSVTPRQSLLPGLLMVFFMVFALVVENAVDSWERAEQLVFLMVLVGGVVALLGVGQYVLGATGDAAWVDSDMFSSVTIRVYSTLQNPNVLAEYLILMISLGGAALLTAKGTGKRLVLLACCGVMCLCMVLTMSRGGWLGLLIAGMIFLVLLNPRVLVLAPVVLPVALVAPLLCAAGYRHQPLHQHRKPGGHLHVLPGVHLDGHHSHAEGLLAVRHRAGHRGFQSGLPGIQLQRSQCSARP